MLLLIRNATLADCDATVRKDLWIKDGVILAVGETPPGRVDREIDGGGLTLMPSFVDLHAHFRDPGFTQKEDIHTGCRAAAHGGYTAVNLMPNNNPICSDMKTVRYIREKALALGICDVFQTVSITKEFDGVTLSHLDGLDSGEIPWLTDDGNGVEPSSVIIAAMGYARERGFGLMLHEEDRALTPLDSYLAEELPTIRDVRLAEFIGCRTHFCHVSTSRSIEAIAEGKKRGAPITCEVSPHHLVLNDQNPGKVAPPLRGESHRRAMIDAVKSGIVDAIATDHAPHTPEDKSAGANGFTGLDLAFPTCYTILVREEEIGLNMLSKLMSRNPAQIMGVPGGLIRVGEPANLVLIDLNKSFTATESHIHSKSKNSPMLGKELWGEVYMTIKGGKITYERDAH